jgi:malate dehydrogenase (oxaloacetate-decarboxylating)(NADP+)
MTANSSSVAKRGIDLLCDPLLNRSTAFTEAERETLGLTGLLPAGVDEETQIQRVLQQLGQNSTDLERYLGLIALLDTNETLFYKVLMSDPARFLPIVHAPTVGEACLKLGHILRRPRGLYLSLKHRGRIREVLRNWPVRDVRVICATSGERGLGLGDLGANGMGISIGKAQIYTACAGIPPQDLLPIHIDLGTNNQDLLNDPLYLGLHQPRIPTAERDEFVEEFVQAVQEIFPGCCLHFEDWAEGDAVRLLARYRDRLCCYADDIHGTAGVALAGILGALRITGGQLRDQRILFLGAGPAAIGIADLLTSAMTLEGLPAEQARARIFLFDRSGLIESSRTDVLDFQKPYAHSLPPAGNFVAVIESIQPTAIIGLSAQGKAFDQPVIEAMARINARPIIFALSSSTDQVECTAEEAYRWSEGRALYAAGVAFPPVSQGDKTLVPGQGNNLYIFPAVALAVHATQARRITDEMLVAAARGVAEQVTQSELEVGLLYPPRWALRPTAIATALRVAEVIFARGLAGMERPEDLRSFLESHFYRPESPNPSPSPLAASPGDADSGYEGPPQVPGSPAGSQNRPADRKGGFRRVLPALGAGCRKLLHSVRFWAFFLLCLIVAVVAYYALADRYTPFTTDAYVQAYVTQVAPQVEGQVIRVHVRENQAVKQGELLFELDPRPFEHRVALLEAKLVQARHQVTQWERELGASRADDDRLVAEENFARAVFRQEEEIYRQDSTTERKYLDAMQKFKAAQAARQRGRELTRKTEEGLAARIGDEHALVAEVRAQLAEARLNLAYCRVHAPSDGLITNLQLREGAYAHTGQAVLTCIDTSQWLIVGNFRENSLERMREGQPALVSLSGRPGRLLRARVRWVGWGVSQGQGIPSGLLPNVKNQTQWLPPTQPFQVRLSLDENPDVPLRVGMRGSVSVYTEPEGFLNDATEFVHQVVAWWSYL